MIGNFFILNQYWPLILVCTKEGLSSEIKYTGHNNRHIFEEDRPKINWTVNVYLTKNGISSVEKCSVLSRLSRMPKSLVDLNCIPMCNCHHCQPPTKVCCHVRKKGKKGCERDEQSLSNPLFKFERWSWSSLWRVWRNCEFFERDPKKTIINQAPLQPK